MKHLALFLILIVLCSTESKGQLKWKTFTHKNGFSISLPNYFKQGIYVATLQYYDNNLDSTIDLAVETVGSGTKADLIKNYNSEIQSNKKISYSLLKAKWYVVSGIDDNIIYYDKIILKHDILYRLTIRYPSEKKETVDKILGKIAESFK